MLGRAGDLETLGFLSGEVSLASKQEELLIAIARRCRGKNIVYKQVHRIASFGKHKYTQGHA